MTDTCRHIEERYVEHGEDLLVEPEVSEHIGACPHCSEVYRALEDIDEVLQALPVVDAAQQSTLGLDVDHSDATADLAVKGSMNGDTTHDAAFGWTPAAADLSSLADISLRDLEADADDSQPAAPHAHAETRAALHEGNAPAGLLPASSVDWSQPGPWKRPRKGRSRWIYVLAGSLSTTAAMAAAATFVFVVRPTWTESGTPVTAMQAPAPEPETVEPAEAEPTARSAKSPSPKTSKGGSVAPAAATARSGGDDREGIDVVFDAGKKRGKAGTGGKGKGRSKTRASKGSKSAPMDDVFDSPKAGKPQSSKEKISIQDIVNGVKKNASKVMPCLKAARAKGEIVPGSYKLVLDWKIKPDGSVSGGRLKGPSQVMGTSLPGCFARAMGKWRFPSSRKGAPVKNFPFGPFTVK